MSNNEIKRAIDNTLSSINCSEQDIRQVLDEAKGEPFMKRKISMSLVVAIAILLVAVTALAVGLIRSSRNEVLKDAREAVMEVYGLTFETIGLFNEEATDDDGIWTIVYRPTYFNHDAIGIYTATVENGVVSQIAWSHDGTSVDLANADLDSPVWGAKQLEMALIISRDHGKEKYETMKQLDPKKELTLEERAALDQVLLINGRISIVMDVAPSEDDIQEDEAIVFAKEALGAQYGLAREELDLYTIQTRLMDMGEYRSYMILGQNADGASFDVKFKTPSGEILSCTWRTEPELWRLPDGSLDGYKEAVQQYVTSGAFRLLSLEDKAGVSERILAAGYGEIIGDYHFVPPEIDDLSQSDAEKAANEAIHEKYSITEDALTLFDLTAGIVLEGDARNWLFQYTPTDVLYWSTDFEPKYGTYEILIDAKSGAVSRVSWSLYDVSTGITYTKNTWAQAPAWGGDLLPFIVEFDAAQRALEEKYVDERSTLWSLEDFAARDQLFRDAGFSADEEHYMHGLPRENDIAQEKAIQIAHAVLKEDYGMTDERLETILTVAYFYVNNPEQPVWVIDSFITTDGIQSGYSVTIEATSGTILNTEYTTGGNG